MQTDTKNNYRLAALISVLGLASVLIGLIISVLLREIRLAGWMVMALGVLLLGIAFVIDIKNVGRAVTGKRGVFRAGTTVMVSIIIGIILLVNAISISNYSRFDTTGLSQFTLTSQTQDVLKQLDSPIQTLVFNTPLDTSGVGAYIDNLLTEYQVFTEFLSVENIDPDEHPDQARLYGIEIYPAVVFKNGDKFRVVLPVELFPQVGEGFADESEHALTSAILEITGIKQKKLYFLTGNGENNVIGDYSSARQALTDFLYNVGVIDLEVTPVIPDDITALVIAGPQEPLTNAETEIIKAYLEDSGWLFLLLNPASPPEYGQLLSDWGVEIKPGVVIDPTSYVSPSIDSPLVPRDRNALGFADTYFPGATAVIPQEGYSDFIALIPLFYSSGDSWLETEFDAQSEPVFDEETEEAGPLALGVLIAGLGETESDEPGLPEGFARVIVIGDSDFASNRHFFNGDNGDLFIGLIELLTEGEELVSIDRKVLPFRRLLITQENSNFINISSIILLPFLVLLTGAVIWWRRR